ncbi:MAG: hypothetical protein EOO09_19725 [Chitinophagaceae bacterium]|nr:MAG: hypothetical protein EOO09_19725 [Chitinophagaceae bacterium]
MLLPGLALILSSCATYNAQVGKYYSSLRQGDYSDAANALDKNKLLKKDRNRLLYLLERGKLCYMMQQWDSSNRYLNEADAMMESSRRSAGDIIAGTLINPMMKRYRAEDFESYLVHYYKAINYLQLGQRDEAMVEARRIQLRTDAQEDKAGNKNRYSDDAFSNIVQGLIYESGNDFNNAFISYRNAADIFLGNKGEYYGTSLPAQLQKDLVRSAQVMGFNDEADRYTRLFSANGIVPTPDQPSDGGELVLFWENGSAPVKAQEDLFFTAVKGAGGAVFFTDGTGRYNNIPFISGYDNNTNLGDLRSMRVAIPKYEAQPLLYQSAVVTLNGSSFPLEQAEDINNLAFATLRERMVKELATTLTRLAVKKIAEAAVRGNQSSGNDKNKTAAQKKKEKKEENTREAIALGMQLLSFASEKADTRNWQSLPHSIYYVRIPLQKGMNEIELTLGGRASRTIRISAEGKGGMQMKTVSTLGSGVSQ